MNSYSPNSSRSFSTLLYLLSRVTLLPNCWTTHISRSEVFAQFQNLVSHCLSRDAQEDTLSSILISSCLKKKKKDLATKGKTKQAAELSERRKAAPLSSYRSQEAWRSSIPPHSLFLLSRSCNYCPPGSQATCSANFEVIHLKCEDSRVLPLSLYQEWGEVASSVGTTKSWGFLQPESSDHAQLFRLLCCCLIFYFILQYRWFFRLLLSQEHYVRNKGACRKSPEEFLQEKVVFLEASKS